MGFFGRLANLWKGFINNFIGDVEKEHPEIAYENAINSLIEKYNKLKTATAAVVRRREDAAERLKKTEEELAQVNMDLETALDMGKDDAANKLAEKQIALEGEVESLKAELAQCESDANECKGALREVESEIQKLKAEKDRNLAKMKSAEARKQVQEQLNGLSVNEEIKSLEGVRENIRNLEAEVKLNTELKSNTLDNDLAEIRRASANTAAKDRVAAMKAARAAKAAGQKTI